MHSLTTRQILVCVAAVAAFSAFGAETAPRPVPRPALLERMVNGPDIIGMVSWGLNTYTDKEWGYGDVDPKLLNPPKFDADQIVGAAKAGGIGGLVIVAKHHDGFCLWPTKTTDYNIAKTPFWRGTGRDYVKEIELACRRHGLKFGVYVSPWDRHDADYASEKYVDKYHAQIRELLGGDYGEVFEMWFDGANGGDGWYGGAKEKRRIGSADEYYRIGDVFRFVRELQPDMTLFAGENDGSDFRWPGNEQGVLDSDSRATIETVGGFVNRRYGNPNYRVQINKGSCHGGFFRVCEADFPLRKGWFWHERENGTTKSAAYLTKLYLSSVGNGGTMDIGLAPNKDGILDEADVKALAGFGVMRRALFLHEVKDGSEPFNVVVMSEDISKGERVDEWEFVADGKAILRGKSIGAKRIRLLETPCEAKAREAKVLKGADGADVSFRLYLADPSLVRTILDATTESGETDTAKWMTACDKEETCPVSENVRGHENTEWQIAYAYHLTDDRKNLPRVLLVGDSICNGYQGEVRKPLEGKLSVSYWISSYCVTSPNYMKFLSLYLDEAKYDVVHFNNGLHSLQTTTDVYAKGIRAALELVRRKQPKAKIVWCSSTPLKDAAKTAKAKELNVAAAEIVAEIGGIETNDLFALLNPLDREENWRDVFHHKKETCKMEAKQVADAVLRVIR